MRKTLALILSTVLIGGFVVYKSGLFTQESAEDENEILATSNVIAGSDTIPVFHKPDPPEIDYEMMSSSKMMIFAFPEINPLSPVQQSITGKGSVFDPQEEIDTVDQNSQE